MEENPLEIISSIIKICRDRPEVTSHAIMRLSEIIRQYDPNSDGNEQMQAGNAKRDIMLHVKSREKEGELIKLKSTTLRLIAATLAKNFDLSYNPKTIKKKCDLFNWFEEHWGKIRDPFFILLDQNTES